MIFENSVIPMERCPSGLRCKPGTFVWGQLHRGFESLPLRFLFKLYLKNQMITNFFKTQINKEDFREKMQFLIESFAGKKIVIYGIGKELEILLNNFNLKKLNIIAICDNNVQNEKEFCGIKVISSSQIQDYDYDFIFIAQDNLFRAQNFLVENLQINPDKIVHIVRTEIFDEKIYLKYLKNIHYKKQFSKLVSKMKNKKVVIYGGNSFLQAINKCCDLKKLNIVAICDMKFKMHKENETFLGYPVCATSEIKTLKPDYVLFAQRYMAPEMMELLYYTALSDTDIKILNMIKMPILKTIKEICAKKNIAEYKKIPAKIKIKRILNFLINRYCAKFKYNTYKKYQIPNAIRLETCTLCQLKCSSCYMRKYDHSAVGDGWLKFSDFKNFVDENPKIRKISVSNNGEIFLNPQLADIIKYSYEHNIKLDAYTGVNLNTLSDEVAEALVKYQFEYMVLSIDGASQETYSKYRVNGNFDKVIENIKKINFYKAKYNSEFPRMKWKFILFDHNEHEILKAKQMAKDLNVDIVFSLPWGDKTFTPKNPEFVKKETGIKFASVGESQEKTGKKRALNLCARVFSAPQINYDGKLLGCCILFKEHYGVNIFQEGFERGLNSAEFQYTVRMLRGEMPPCEDIPCTYCNEYNSFTYNNAYYE